MTIHCVFADPHAHNFKQFASGAGVENSRLQTTLKVIHEIQDFCVQANIHSAICLGDIFESRSATRFDYFNAVYRTFARFKELDIDLKIICGNHDYVTASHSITTIDTFADFATIFREPTPYSQNLAFIPHTSKFDWHPDSFWSTSCVLGHLDLLGASVSKDYKAVEGFEPSLFEGYKVVLLGHYHIRQRVRDHIFYIGTCCPKSFGEEGEPGYFCVLDDETGQVQWHYTSAPKFVKWDPVEIGDHTQCQGSYVKIVAEPRDDLDNDMRRFGAKAWIYEPPPKQKPVMLRNQGVRPDSSHEELIKSYVELNAGDLSKDELIEIGLELLRN